MKGFGSLLWWSMPFHFGFEPKLLEKSLSDSRSSGMSEPKWEIIAAHLAVAINGCFRQACAAEDTWFNL